jgi:hypothetical protein
VICHGTTLVYVLCWWLNHHYIAHDYTWTSNVNIHKVLLQHSHARSFTIVYGCFYATLAELNNCDKDCGPQNLALYICLLTLWCSSQKKILKIGHKVNILLCIFIHSTTLFTLNALSQFILKILRKFGLLLLFHEINEANLLSKFA